RWDKQASGARWVSLRSTHPIICPFVRRRDLMLCSMWLLAATCLANDPVSPPNTTPATGTPAPYYVKSAEQADQGNGLGLRKRLANLLHGHRPQPQVAARVAETIYQSPEPALAPEPAVITQAVRTIKEPAPANVPLPSQETVQKTAIADDASWIIGQLTYVHSDGGLWLVRYAPLDREDRFGGAVVLAAGSDMSKFREGDMVFVKGEVLNQGRSFRHLGAPLYRVTSIDLNERPGD